MQALFHAAQGLAALEVPAEWHISPGVGHGIDQEGLRQGGEFLARCFAAPQIAGLRVTPRSGFTILSRCPITSRQLRGGSVLRRSRSLA